MNLNCRLQLAGAAALAVALACATPTIGDDPGTFDPDGPIDSGATGGSAPAGGGMPGSGGTTSTAGTDASSSGGGPGAATGGTTAMSGGGRVGRATGGAGAGMGGGLSTCPMPRAPATPGMKNGDSGSFATADAVCYFVTGMFNAWNCSNLGGRMVTVNGTPTLCGGALPTPLDGGYYFEFSASPAGTDYTSFYWYTQ